MDVERGQPVMGPGSAPAGPADGAPTWSEAHFRLVWEKSADGMRLADADGRTVLVNDTYCQMVGLERDELEGRPFYLIYPEDRRAHIHTSYRAFVARGHAEPAVEREVV